MPIWVTIPSTYPWNIGPTQIGVRCCYPAPNLYLHNECLTFKSSKLKVLLGFGFLFRKYLTLRIVENAALTFTWFTLNVTNLDIFIDISTC